MSKASSLIFITLILTQISQAGEWRGIAPLRSTRANVERLLGPPEKGSRNIYITEAERISVTYAEDVCAYGWKVAPDTVVSFSVSPKNPPKFVDFKLDESKYVKRRDYHIESIYYYVNEAEGINYTVDVDRGVVTGIEYYPSAKDNHMRCAPTKASNGGTSELSTAERVRQSERLSTTYEYTCAMHPDVRQAQAGTCPKCGMTLSTVKPSVIGEYKLDLTTKPLKPKAGEKVQLRFVISNPQTGARVKDYVLNHEKLFHLFIVSQDMTEYQHIHPQLERDGSFTVETVLPRNGLYKIHADFFPAGGTLQVLHRDLSTAGYSPSGTSAPALLTPDTTLVKTVDGMRISLELVGAPAPAAGVLVSLRYRLTTERMGEPVRDLEPYLGAWGHTLILNADQSEYLHSHPTVMLPDNVNPATLRGGPVIEFQTMFPVAGNYRIWTQFQRAGRVITVSFTIRIVA